TALLPSPPARDADRCVGCHAIARGGDAFSAALYGEPREGIVFDFDGDISRDPADGEPVPGSDFGFSALSTDGNLLIASIDGRLRAFDAFEMDTLDLGLPTELATQPALGDEGELYYIAADATERFEGSTLRVAGFEDGAYRSPETLFNGSELSAQPEGGATVAHPTLGPDPQWLVFAHGPQSWLGPEERLTESALYLSVDGRSPVRLTRLLPGGMSSATWPSFAPRAVGEGSNARYWLVFLSRAPFGGADGTLGTDLRQLWLASLDPNAPAGSDPSHPPVRVPLQSSDTHNLGAAFRALDCIEPNERCVAGPQCCSGRCAPDEDEDYACD
ncbi:MAG: hypothetical protein AAF645_18925, partial [Myxococcota bacterium]